MARGFFAFFPRLPFFFFVVPVAAATLLGTGGGAGVASGAPAGVDGAGSTRTGRRRTSGNVELKHGAI